MRGLIGIFAVACFVMSISAAAAAAKPNPPKPPPVTCDPSGCSVSVTGGAHLGTGGHSASDRAGCNWKGAKVACSDPDMGTFNPQDGCYYQIADPLPRSGPILAEYMKYGGGIYVAACPFGNRSGGYVWLRKAPPGVGPTPAELAQRALASLKLPHPTTGRSPAGKLRDGRAFTVVRSWTWVWTDPASYKTLSARAAAGGVWAEVTVNQRRSRSRPAMAKRRCRAPGPGGRGSRGEMHRRRGLRAGVTTRISKQPLAENSQRVMESRGQ